MNAAAAVSVDGPNSVHMGCPEAAAPKWDS